MDKSWLVIYLLIITLISLIAWVLGTTLLIRFQTRRRKRKTERLEELIRQSVAAGKITGIEHLLEEHQLDYLLEWEVVAQDIEIPDAISQELSFYIKEWNIQAKVESKLRSRFLKNRVSGIRLSDLFDNQTKAEILCNHLISEPKLFLRLKMVYLLCETGIPDIVDYVVNSMEGAEDLYRKKLSA